MRVCGCEGVCVCVLCVGVGGCVCVGGASLTHCKVGTLHSQWDYPMFSAEEK